MPPKIAERCDLAVWELEPGLLDALGDRLSGTQTVQGPLVDTVIGHLHNRHLLVVSLKTRQLSEALQAVASAHGPRQTLLVGPASAVSVDLAPGVLLHATRIERNRSEALSLSSIELPPLSCGTCGDGPVFPSEQPEVMATSNWAYDAALAAERSCIEIAIALAIVTPRSAELGVEETIQPPHRRQSLARRAGGVVSALWWRPKSVGALLQRQSARWEQGEQFADALEELVQQLP